MPDTEHTETLVSDSFEEHRKEVVADVELAKDIQQSSYFVQKRIERVFGVGRRFEEVSFKQSIIEDCYFRNCTFQRCDFTGSHISGSNFQGAKFEGCNFAYATFEGTELELDILKYNMPSFENQKRALARSLRTNFADMGIYEGVNLAILVELQATLEHYRKVAFSPEGHYRNKYKGLTRAKYAWKYVTFWALDKFWGNGEKPWRLIWVALITWFIGVAYGVTAANLTAGLAASASAKALVLGIESQLGTGATIFLAFARYVFFGLFIASLIKRMARR